MANEERDHVGREKMTPPAEGKTASGRRQVLKLGAMVVPTIVTLHASPAWAQTDYRFTAYRYGVNKGLCYNEHYNPNANPNSQASQEFIECPRGRGRDHDSTSDQQGGSGPIDF